MQEPAPATDEQWQAILNNDASYNGQFYYAVKSTGIFCYPSCKSKPPKRENIGIYYSTEQALTRFRPCKRCKPTGQRLPDEEWIAVVTEYIERNYGENLKLEHLANICHGTPYHLHRTFKKVKGMTPAAFIQQFRIDNAKDLLRRTDKTVAEVGECVGLPNTPYFITLFKKMTGYTPESYRKWHKQHANL